MRSPFMAKPVESSEARADSPAPITLVPKPQPATPARPYFGHPWLIGSLSALVVIAAIAVVWWSLSASGTVHYTTAPVTRGPVTRAVIATGTVNPVITIMVGSYVSGVIQTCTCDYNTEVKAGQLCAKIDPRPYQTVVDQDTANLAMAKAQLEKDKASLVYAKLTYDRRRAAGADQRRLAGHARQRQERLRPGAGADRRRRGDDPAAPGAARSGAGQPRLHQHRLAGGRHRGLAQRHQSGRRSRRASRRRRCS